MISQDAIVFIVDDDPEVRNSIELLVKSVQHQTSAFATATDFLAAYDGKHHGCLVLDMRLPGMSGLELQKTLNQRQIRLPVIMMSAYGEIPMAVEALKNGALDFLQKPFSPQSLIEQIQIALSRDRKRHSLAADDEHFANRLASLSPRERDVFDRLVAGGSAKQIAAELGISPKTVDNHRAKILEKLEVDSTVDLVRRVFSRRSLAQ